LSCVVHSSIYSDVARWIFGIDSIDGNSDVIQKAIHGCKEKLDHARIPNTGAIHFVANQIKLREYALHCDLNPRLFIVPVMTVQQMKDWNGEGYEAIVLAADWNDFEASSVYVEIGMQSCRDNGDLATPQQIHTACTTLKAVVLGLHYSIRHRHGVISRDLVGQAESLAVFEEFRTKVGHSKEAIVPECKPLAESTRDVRVRLIRFQSHSAEDGHPAPDPMLLCVKSGVNWSWRNGQQLLPGCEPDKDDHEYLDSMQDEDDDDDESLDSTQDEEDESLDFE
jgi:hypothetical protein